MTRKTLATIGAALAIVGAMSGVGLVGSSHRGSPRIMLEEAAYYEPGSVSPYVQ